ncbi:MAG: ABC transporter permease [Pseudomonadales bacterium]|nr:ABC transporter permease [Pseudomonadales bacterium]MCP5345196.1 ABC transporter permease [Pseudomonadales bacterium]MCP5358612.1 ABC transporter permease [Pseudomonadales bacterium]
MFLYYVRLSMLSYKRNPVLSTLMVLAVAVGVGAYMVIFTLNYFMGGDPIPQKSGQLFHLQLDYGNPAIPDTSNQPQMAYVDTLALLDAPFAYAHSASSKFMAVLEPSNPDLSPFFVDGRGNTADFFTMFDVPFEFGGGWDRAADDTQQQVIVLSQDLNLRLFGGENSVGRDVELQGIHFTVVGVLDYWEPAPKFFDENNGAFNRAEEAYIPWSLIVGQQLRRSGNTNCWEPPKDSSFESFLNAECAWIQFWVELPTPDDQQIYADYLASYVAQERAAGRMQIPIEKRLFNVREWMAKREVQPDETRILSALAAMLLAVCLLNTVGLLLSKFLGKAAEIGVRQALGAHKGALFRQHVIEAGFLGAIGGVLGLGVASLGLEGVKILMGGERVNNEWMHLDLTVAAITIALAVISTIIAGLYPIWRACNVNPAIHLKAE